MNKSKILMLTALLVLSNSAFSQTFYNDKGLEVGVGGTISAGIKSQTYEVDDYKSSKIGIEEDTAVFQLNFKKTIDKLEAGGNLRYGKNAEVNGDRLGGDMYVKYNFSNNFWTEYRKFDFGYTGSYISGNGTGIQLDLTPIGQWQSFVLSNNGSQYGTAFLGVGSDKVSWSGGDYGVTGKIWNSFMAYSYNKVNYGMKPSALNFGYNTDKLKVIASAVYNDKEISDNSSNIEATNKGLMVKANYKLSDNSKVGLGVSYGDGKTDSSTETSDRETQIVAQNAYYNTKINDISIFLEMAHSNYSLKATSGAEKELVGAYSKVSKPLNKVIPYLELKVAQSSFSKEDGVEYSDEKINTLIEVSPGISIPLTKLSGASIDFLTTFGSYKTENIGGVSGIDEKDKQVSVATYFTYNF